MTLIELLVVIAIIGTLAAVLLPVVQRARESARQTACISNQRQIGVAIASYNTTYRRLPYGCLEWRPNSRSKNRQLAWSATIVPFMDGGSAMAIDFTKAYDHADNAKAAETKLPVYLCPSVTRVPQQRGPTDYGGLFGQRLTTKTNTDNGVFIYNKSFRVADIIDGVSTTIAVSEDSAGPDSEWINGRNVFEQSGGINDPKSWIGDNEIRSLHTGGAAALFCDSSVHFLSESMDLEALAALISRNMRDRAPAIP